MDAWFERSGARYTLGVARRLTHPPAKVWRALTEKKLLSNWFPADIDGDWRVGAPLQFTFRHGEGAGLSEDEMRGEVLAVEDERLLEFRWGQGVIKFELEPDGEGSRFVLTETHDDPSMAARNAAGWEMCLEALGAAIQGAALGEYAWAKWRQLFDRYVQKFEPKFGPQQGPPEDHPAAKTDGG